MKVKSTGKTSPGVPQVTVDRRQGGATSFAILSKQSINQVLKRCIQKFPGTCLKSQHLGDGSKWTQMSRPVSGLKKQAKTHVIGRMEGGGREEGREKDPTPPRQQYWVGRQKSCCIDAYTKVNK